MFIVFSVGNCDLSTVLRNLDDTVVVLADLQATVWMAFKCT